ncbi:MOSC domain-containing protein [Nocardioides daejeonensis]|uniref:MOSC domain-containing protein n=1 Tax=Nocardioides daejeonensis TaxID=1046556 RepID=UPI000D74E291|nr:MOSC N-terminal beta barrel domain-containing protein [Nocardioides daejeonensis]
MALLSIRRHPVKSCGGEALDVAEVDRRGLLGDRAWAVVDPDGKLGSGKDGRRFRRLDRIFELGTRWTDDVPEVLFPDGGWRRVDAPEVDILLSAHIGADVRFGREGETPHMDAGSVSLVGTASLQALADLTGDPEPVDPRHFRVNLVVETEEPWLEESWLGAEIQIGEVVLRGVKRITRCRMVDIEQDGATAHGQLLKTLGREREAKLAVYFDVVTPGTIRVGDPVVLR